MCIFLGGLSLKYHLQWIYLRLDQCVFVWHADWQWHRRIIQKHWQVNVGFLWVHFSHSMLSPCSCGLGWICVLLLSFSNFFFFVYSECQCNDFKSGFKKRIRRRRRRRKKSHLIQIRRFERMKYIARPSYVNRNNNWNSCYTWPLAKVSIFHMRCEARIYLKHRLEWHKEPRPNLFQIRQRWHIVDGFQQNELEIKYMQIHSNCCSHSTPANNQHKLLFQSITLQRIVDKVVIGNRNHRYTFNVNVHLAIR